MAREEWEQLRAIADAAEGRLAKQLVALIETLVRAESLRRLERAVRLQQTAQIMQAIVESWQLSTAEYQTILGNELLSLYQRAGGIAGEHLANLNITFDLTNPEAVQFARTRSSAFIQNLDLETKQTLRAAISRSFVEGIPPAETAKAIRETIGLAPSQAKALQNYRDFLERLSTRDSLDALPPSVMERIRRSDIRLLPKRIMTEGRIDRMVDAYRGRLVRERVLGLVRTETQAASNEGQQALWRQAIADELIDEQKTQRKWITTPDDRICPICKPMQGQLRGINEPFRSPYNGATATVPPIHFKCRCAMGLVFKRKAN